MSIPSAASFSRNHVTVASLTNKYWHASVNVSGSFSGPAMNDTFHYMVIRVSYWELSAKQKKELLEMPFLPSSIDQT